MVHVLKCDLGMASKLPSKATIVKWQGKWRVLGWYSSVFLYLLLYCYGIFAGEFHKLMLELMVNVYNY